MFCIFGIDLFLADIVIFCYVVNGHIGQHEDYMGSTSPEVLAHEDNQLVS